MRPPRLLRSSGFRLALVYLCLFSAAVLVIFGLIYWSATDSVTRQTDATIEAEIRGLAEQFQRGGTAGLLDSIRRRSASPDPSRGLYLLADETLAPLAGNLSRWPDATPDRNGWISFPLELPAKEGVAVNSGRAKVFRLGGGLHLLVGHDIRERSRVAAHIRNILVSGLAVTIGLAVIGGALMSRSLLRRVEAINQASREIMAGDLGRRVPLAGRDDEFDQLAANLNAMLAQIERLMLGMKQVTENIAHDLKSPLARLRSRLELTLIEDREAESQREAIEQAIAEADRLLEIFTALLNIAQAESGAARQRFEPVALAALATDAAELYEPLAEERGLTLTTEVGLDAEVRGDRDLLFQALSNLLDNAIKHSTAGARVGISLDVDATEVALVVWDRGPGIPKDQRERVLERFYRLESSRSTPGSGLGLSLVAAVAGLHGGRLRLEDNRPGLRACLVLPRDGASGSRPNSGESAPSARVSRASGDAGSLRRSTPLQQFRAR